MPYYLHIVCGCEHYADIEWPDPTNLNRQAVLAAARCGRCGRKGACDLRLYYGSTAFPMDGTRISSGKNDFT